MPKPPELKPGVTLSGLELTVYHLAHGIFHLHAHKCSLPETETELRAALSEQVHDLNDVGLALSLLALTDALIKPNGSSS